jgi:ssDNA-specific exonuclease RecJ
MEQHHQVLTLFNISEENILKNFPAIDIDTIHQNRKKNLSFYLLISSNLSDYLDGLHFLETAYSFFEANAIFTTGSFKNFPTDIDNIQLNFQSTSFEELHFIWKTLDAKYQPSFVYKVMLSSK